MELLKQFEFEKDYSKFLVNPIGHFQITLHLCFKTSFYEGVNGVNCLAYKGLFSLS